MGLVAGLLAVEVLLPIATRAGRRAWAILRSEAFGAGPDLQQRAVDREMLARKLALHRWLRGNHPVSPTFLFR